jgi:sigma-54 dependent transcriptional regulator, acetoin dehydrogenase operon transcriptional activator AcoR
MSNLINLRRHFQEGRTVANNAIDRHIFQSWQRCASMGLDMMGKADYNRLDGHSLKRILDRNAPLLQAAEPHLQWLQQAISRAGWSILLTDNQSIAIHTVRSCQQQDSRIDNAFAVGTLLSEAAIGTSAMSCALADQRFTRVYGFEHYNEYHRQFHCAATPIFDPLGKVCGALDITSANPDRNEGVFLLLRQCARQIQTDMIHQLPDSLAIILGSTANTGPGGDSMVLAVNPDGYITGANRLACQVLGLQLQDDRSLHFEQLFDNAPADLSRLQQSSLPLRLHNGITLFAHIPAIGKPSLPFLQSRSLHQCGSGKADKQAASTLFGDTRISENLTKACQVITRLPILLQGESGTGKEIAATYLHNNSAAADGPLVSLNCAAIPENLIESELFGYQPGAFTGASKQGQKGKLQQANGGTLFLDEIGDMPAALQTRLLRALETREVTPLGGGPAQPLNFQLICATHQNLPQQIENGAFRLDLYYRINGFKLTLSPLRERQNILALAANLLAEFARSTTPINTRHSQQTTPRSLSAELQRFIMQYPWPGNVRQLKHALTYADALAEPDAALTLSDLPEELTAGYAHPLPATEDQPWPPGSNQTPHPEHNSSNTTHSLGSENIRLIEDTLRMFDGNISKAANHLGVARSTIYRKLGRI